jgi:UDP-arabinose 4-epimerase
MNQNEANKRILVTGGAGYIGSHACKALARAGYGPVAYDNLAYGHEWAVKWGPLEIGDIADRERLDEVIEKYAPMAVLHFAAFAYVGESVADPLKYYRNNVAGALTLLEAMRDNAINKIVFSSSCATYGEPNEVPIPEGHPQDPINPYGASKLMVERILADVGTAHGIRSVALRYFNAAGADPGGEIGEDHDPETHLIPLVLRAVGRGNQELKIFGTDYSTPDGTCIRDYIHVDDLADAHVKALQALERGVSTTACNLGTGQGFSVREIIAAAERVTGREISVVEAPRRPGDPPRLVADAGYARELLGWRPIWTDVEGIIETAWKWEQKSRQG